jgi:hypothetical protein
VEAQKALESILPDVKKVDGVKSVERIVCGGCLDFKVITSLPAEKFGEWEAKEFAPEAAFLEKLKGINGVSLVETQTFTVCYLTLCIGLFSHVNAMFKVLLVASNTYCYFCCCLSLPENAAVSCLLYTRRYTTQIRFIQSVVISLWYHSSIMQ